MGESVNTAATDLCPKVSEEGCFLFFNSWPHGNADNYRMDGSFIETLRARALG